MSDDFAKPKNPTFSPSANTPSPEEDDFWELGDLPETGSQPDKGEPSKKTEQPSHKAPIEAKMKTDGKQQSVENTLKAKQKLTPNSLLETISLICFSIILLLALSVSARALYKLLPTGPAESFKAKLPITGKIITLNGAETYWVHAANEEGSKISTRENASIIPAATLRTSKNSSGIIRCFFFNSKDEIVGDGITLILKDGIFEKSGNDTINIQSTSGFPQKSDFALYQTNAGDKDERWRISINEASKPNALSADLKEIARLPISPVLSSSEKSN